MKTVNLAKALVKNKNCWGYIYPVKGGLYQFQNDNDLGLDLDALDIKLPYIKKEYICGRYYAYLLDGEAYDEEGVTLEEAKALLHECHTWSPLTTNEKLICDRYWSQF